MVGEWSDLLANLTKIAAFSATILAISKVLGISREMALAYKFGTSYVVDAYTISVAVPSVLFGIYAGGFAESYIPVCTEIEEEERNKFFSTTLTVLTLISLLISIACYFCSDSIAAVMAPGLDDRSFDLAGVFIREIAFMLPAMLIFNILVVHAQVHEDFIVSDICNSILIQLIIILSIILASYDDAFMLAYGYVVAQSLATVVLYCYMKYKQMFTYKISFDVFNPGFRKLCNMAIPLGASIIVNRINVVTDKMFAAGFGEGVIGALNYADKMQLIAYSFTTAVFITVCYPRISRFFGISERQNGMAYVHKAVSLTGYVSFPLLLAFVIFAEPIVELTFSRGEFNSDSVDMTATCLRAYSMGVVFYSMRETTTRLLAVCRLQNLILKNTVVSVVANIAFNYLFMSLLGYKGIALATSFSGALAFLLMLRDLHKQEIVLFNREQVNELRLIILLALTSNGVCWLVQLGLSRYCEAQMAFLVGVSAAVISYLFLSIAFKVNIFIWVYNKLPPQYQIISFFVNFMR